MEDYTNLVWIGGSFAIVVALFIFALFKFVLTNKPKEREFNIDLSSGFSLDDVKIILDSKHSTLQDLQNVVNKFFEEYDKLDIDKRDIKSMLVAISLHPNAEKNIILETQKKFEEKHPEWAMEFERAVKKGLDARGFRR